ncbi:MAG TPA: hypothetical protein VGH90_03680, partial [Chthoniobacteraceae bacterium]
LPLTTSPLDPYLRLGEIPTYFVVYFFRPYRAVCVVTLVMIALRIFSVWREPGERRIKPIDLILAYFWITAILHYLLSLSYCVDCIIPYANYFVPVGALAAAALLGEISRLTRGRAATYTAFAALGVIAVAMQASPFFPTLLRPASDSVRAAATQLALQLRPNLSATDRVLVLCERVEAAQAVWLAGGVIVPRSLYLPSNFRKPQPGLPKDERNRIDSIVWSAGFWSEDSMREAIVREYRTLLIERRNSYMDQFGGSVRDGIPFGEVVAAHFELAATLKLGDRTFEVYRRRD